MKLMRNNPAREGKCKYALIRLDKLGLTDEQIANLTAVSLTKLLAVDRQNIRTLIEFGEPESENEFFVVKLKDINAKAALKAYANKADNTDPQLALEVYSLAVRSSENHQFCKQPD